MIGNVFAQDDILTEASPEVFEPSFIYGFMSEAEQLAERLAFGFKLRAEALGHADLPWSIIGHGYEVVARGIMKCKTAYSDHCDQSGKHFDAEELREALVHPRTVEFFVNISRMSNKVNKRFEGHFGLSSTTFAHQTKAFFYDQEDGCVLPNPVILALAERDAELARIERAVQGEPIRNSERCPATRFIPMVWAETVSIMQEEGLLLATQPANPTVAG